MSAKRLGAIFGIYVLTTIAWAILGGVTDYRSSSSLQNFGGSSYRGESTTDRASIQQLWGSPQSQPAPVVWTNHMEKEQTTNAKGKPVTTLVQKQDPVVLTMSRLDVKLDYDPRQKGLLWYSTYKAQFKGDYKFKNEFPDERKFYVKFALPGKQAAYDHVLFFINGSRAYPSSDVKDGVTAPVKLKPGQEANLSMAYGSQGLDSWTYQFGDDQSISSVRDFDAHVVTNCSDIDFPANCLSPSSKQATANGWDLRWKFGDLISGSNVGIMMPHKMNPGPFASRLSFFAPVSLLFFFAVLIILGSVGRGRLHPVHYLMLAGSFFSFHLLFSYMVDHFSLIVSFIAASIVSMLLTISYLRLVVDWKFAMLRAGVWQFVFLVLFAYAFFFDGYTGLTITVGAILTLAVLMHLTGRVNWEEQLSGMPALPMSPVESEAAAMEE